MREVAKSMLGFSWAVSLFGVQQMAKLVTPSSVSPESLASQFDEATRAVQTFLNETAAQQFRAGDEWQRRAVDTLFDAAALRDVDPRRMAEALDPRPFVQGIDARQVIKNGVDMVQQSFETVRQTVTPSPAS
ncbi:MAG: hypothetical protein WD227_16245 [Vicinamibacterales bacterium]